MPKIMSQVNFRRIVIRWGVPLFTTIGIGFYSYIQHGLTWQMLISLLIFWASYTYLRFGLKFLDPINHQLLFPAVVALWVSFLLWDPTEHLPFGSDMEYPHLAGLGFGIVVGVMVVMTKAFDAGETTMLEAVRALRHDFVLLSVVAVSGYGLFIPYSYAMYQVFTEGNYAFSLLALFSMTAFFAFAHNRVKSPKD